MIRQLLLSMALAAVKRGDIRGGYRLTPATLAGLVLASCDGDTAQAGQMMLQAAHLLHTMQKQDSESHQEGTSVHPPPPGADSGFVWGGE